MCTNFFIIHSINNVERFISNGESIVLMERVVQRKQPPRQNCFVLKEVVASLHIGGGALLKLWSGNSRNR
jgi:hypothetical protein